MFTRIFSWNNSFINFVIALVAVIGFLCLFNNWNKTNATLSYFAKYTMPIFLMHTLFAAPMRVVLSKVGLTMWPVQVVMGISISIAGPVIAMMVMQKIYWLEFFVNHWKVIRGKRHVRG